MGGRYVFVAGAPGSRWSAVSKTIYRSPDCDRSDSAPMREYRRSAGDEPMHVGAYWDPGMEYGDGFERLSEYDCAECERMFDAPFSGAGTRLIKAHTFCHHLGFLRRHWRDCCIVLVYRPDRVCLDWWLQAGGFDISYPNYRPYYSDVDGMARHIAAQNQDLLAYMASANVSFDVADSDELCRRLGLAPSAPTLRFAALDAAVGTVLPG